MKELKTNIHHLLPKSRGGSSIPENLSNTQIHFHTALHRVFENRTPIEQIQFLISVNGTALTNEVKSDLIKILTKKELDYFYKKGIIKT